LELQDSKLFGLSLVSNKMPHPTIVKSSSNLCLTGVIKRKAMAKIKFMNKKEDLLGSLMRYTDNMKRDFDGIIQLIYDDTQDPTTAH
jgi:tetratricopeptide (TPR) repeat protein